MYPISFSIPEEKIVHEVPKKLKLVSSVIPGKSDTYVYDNEEEYYKEYQESYFAHTFKKAGWDCFRHYEILANGCIPIFRDIDSIPEKTMVHYPKELLKEIYKEIYKEDLQNNFNAERYNYYANKLLEWTRTHLTTVSMAKYVLNVAKKTDITKVLFISEGGPDYMTALILHGLKQIYKSKCHDYPKVDYMYKDSQLPESKLYGKGFGYAKLLDKEVYRDDKYDNNTLNLIKEHYFDIVIYGSIHRCSRSIRLVDEYYSKDEIILICGEDLHDKCNLEYYSDYIKFKRELSDSEKNNTHCALIEQNYKTQCSTVSDINEHLPTLYEYAQKVDTIVEMGVRSVVSTWALLYGLVRCNSNNSKMLVGVDIEKCAYNKAVIAGKNAGVTVHFIQGDSVKVDVPERDLLFIDTWHVYGHLKRELAKHHSKTRKWIILHDTSVDGEVGESIRMKHDILALSEKSGYPIAEIERGIWPAVEEFLEEHIEWKLEKRYTNNNGLTILVKRW